MSCAPDSSAGYNTFKLYRDGLIDDLRGLWVRTRAITALQRAKMAEDVSFEFIQQHPDDALSKETRTRIRKQAMRAVGARRRNVTQATGPGSRGPPRRRRNLAQSPARSVPTSGLELLVQDGGLDPMDFSALTLIHVQKV